MARAQTCVHLHHCCAASSLRRSSLLARAFAPLSGAVGLFAQSLAFEIKSSSATQHRAAGRSLKPLLPASSSSKPGSKPALAALPLAVDPKGISKLRVLRDLLEVVTQYPACQF